MKNRITVSLDPELVSQLDGWVGEGQRFSNRSEAVEAAVREYGAKMRDRAYHEGLLLLDPEEERDLAEEGMGDYGTLDAAGERGEEASW